MIYRYLKIKITHKIYDLEVLLNFKCNLKSTTRGNKYKLINYTFHYDARKFFLSARVVNMWNNSSNSVVDVNTVNLFKARLDKFWMCQDVKYDKCKKL